MPNYQRVSDELDGAYTLLYSEGGRLDLIEKSVEEWGRFSLATSLASAATAYYFIESATDPRWAERLTPMPEIFGSLPHQIFAGIFLAASWQLLLNAGVSLDRYARAKKLKRDNHLEGDHLELFTFSKSKITKTLTIASVFPFLFGAAIFRFSTDVEVQRFGFGILAQSFLGIQSYAISTLLDRYCSKQEK